MDELDEITEELEEQRNEQYDEQWEKAYELWEEENDPSMMKSMVDQFSSIQKIKAKERIQKKGESLDYDRTDSFTFGTLTMAASIVYHPLILSIWITGGYKILKDSYGKLDNGASDNWERLDRFGLETFYYLVGSITALYFFTVMRGEELILSNAGTVAQASLELYQVVISLA